ncbi:LOW QUALITY PROTEIN: probable E3 ubiquitin-protein ligase HERC4 [Scylla paramamosain]|uniref:LOW QUALITY PROTEIN: probable E3 ubiquitin-protein ligase HERC4 n=1 Tax=Scylla paramamosain TaxID=85552 RepID=UPI0030836052
MYCWGSTVNGELGVGAPEVEQLALPTFMDFSESWRVKQVASGLTHSLFLTEDGAVYSCGNNEVGQLGHGKITRRPELIDELQNYSIVQVAAGDQHSLALTSWGLIYAWGDNGYGQLGVNSCDSHAATPKLVKSLARKVTVQLACGANHTLALTADGELYTWGQNTFGQLGLRHRQGPQKDPALVTSLAGTPLVLLAAAGHHSAAVTQAGYLLLWGSNKQGQLGYTPKGDPLVSDTPALVPNLASYSEPIRYVALGESHTAALDSLGKLWTFGYGRYGQLGHGTTDNCPIPRTVLDLCGSKVGQVACGRGHTLVYIPSQGHVYAFGQGLSGQLGTKTPHSRELPQVVVGPWLSPGGASLLDYAEEDKPQCVFKADLRRGDVSMATVSRESGGAEDFCSPPLPRPNAPLTIQEHMIKKLLSIEEEDMIDDDLFTYAETVFASVCAWNSSFTLAGSHKHTHGLDYRLAEDCVAQIGRIARETIQEVIRTGIQNVAKSLPSHPPARTPYAVTSFFPCTRTSLTPNKWPNSKRRMLGVLKLGKEMAEVFKSWLASLPRDFTLRLVTVYKSVVVQILNSAHQSSSERDRRALVSSLRLLSLVHGLNFQAGCRVGRLNYDDFYIPEIAEKIDIRNDYLNWMNSRLHPMSRRESPILFCEYPFLFDPQAKTLLLRCDATRQMQGAIQEAVLNSNPMLWLFDPAQVQFLNVHIRRTHIVEDTISQLLHHEVTDYKRPLKVHFIGEEAEDAGGVRKEFFLLLLRDILNPDYGMFTEFPDTRRIWFKEGALEAAATYVLIGIVCGLAIYNFTIINLPFPIALYKKLLGETVGLDDLADLDPQLTRSLRDLLEYEGGDEEEVYGLNFTVTQDYFGECKSVPLKAGGEEMSVTQQNKQEYVELLVEYRLNKSIDKQYKAFHDGFYRVCGGIVLKLFQPMELMDLVTGNENYSWSELEKNTEYKGEYFPDHPVIRTFWEVFHELSLEQKKLFLKFLTGTDRVPILGMKALKLIIQSTADDSFLPVAHTCIAQLDLPKYNTKEKLKYKLLQAIQQSEGFGLV